MILYNVHTNQHQEYTLKKYCDEFSNNSLNDGFNVKDDEVYHIIKNLGYDTKDKKQRRIIDNIMASRSIVNEKRKYISKNSRKTI